MPTIISCVTASCYKYLIGFGSYETSYKILSDEKNHDESNPYIFDALKLISIVAALFYLAKQLYDFNLLITRIVDEKI